MWLNGFLGQVAGWVCWKVIFHSAFLMDHTILLWLLVFFTHVHVSTTCNVRNHSKVKYKITKSLESWNVVKFREWKSFKLFSMCQLSKASFPLCMQQLHSSLRLHHHLRHYGRLQYGLFLKGIGMSLEEALRFWKSEFTRIMDGDKVIVFFVCL